MNDYFVVFCQLVQKLEWSKEIISTLQDKQNEWLSKVSTLALTARSIDSIPE